MVRRTVDSLVFSGLTNHERVHGLSIYPGSAAHYLKFSPSGKYMLTSGNGPVSTFYSTGGHHAKVKFSLPYMADEVVFDRNEKHAFLLYTEPSMKKYLLKYDTITWRRLDKLPLPLDAHGFTLNANGSLLAFLDHGNVHLIAAKEVKSNLIIYKSMQQKLLAFHPTFANQLAIVGADNTLRIVDIEKDSILMEMQMKGGNIRWLGFDPQGKVLSTLDSNGHLLNIVPDKGLCIAHLTGVGGLPVYAPDNTLHISPFNKNTTPRFVRKKTSYRLSMVSVRE